MALTLPVRNRAVSANLRAVVLVASTAAVVYLLASHGARPVEAAAAAAIVLLLAAAAVRWPGAAMCGALVVIVAIPVYWGRPVVGAAIVAVPSTVAAVVLAPAAAPMLRRLRLQPLDYWYAGFVLVLALAALVNVTHPIGASVGILWRFFLPYVVWRLVALRWLSWDTVLRVLLFVGTALAVFGINERATGRNLLFTLLPSGYQGGQWAHSIYRDHVIRVEGSFGEPISFGLFLAVCVIAAITVAISAKGMLLRWFAVAGGVVMMVAIVDTQSRTALAAVLVGSAVQWIRLWSTRRAGRLLVIGLLAAAAAVLSPLGAEVQNAMASTSGSSLAAKSAQYRLSVLDVLTEPSQYTLIGHASDTASGLRDLATSESGLKSLDNEYAYALTTSGALGLGAFVGLALTLLWSAVRSRERQLGARAIGSAFAVIAIALLTVALLTQFADFFGIGIALLAATRQREREAV